MVRGPWSRRVSFGILNLSPRICIWVAVPGNSWISCNPGKLIGLRWVKKQQKWGFEKVSNLLKFLGTQPTLFYREAFFL